MPEVEEEDEGTQETISAFETEKIEECVREIDLNDIQLQQIEEEDRYETNVHIGKDQITGDVLKSYFESCPQHTRPIYEPRKIIETSDFENIVEHAIERKIFPYSKFPLLYNAGTDVVDWPEMFPPERAPPLHWITSLPLYGRTPDMISGREPLGLIEECPIPFITTARDFDGPWSDLQQIAYRLDEILLYKANSNESLRRSYWSAMRAAGANTMLCNHDGYATKYLLQGFKPESFNQFEFTL